MCALTPAPAPAPAPLPLCASAYGQKDGLAGAMKTYNPMAAMASGPMLDGGQKLVGWAGYHQVKANTRIPHYLPH